jgi:MscS family membrane protein
VGLRYETTPDQFVWLLPQLRERLAAREQVEVASGLPRVRIIGFGASSVDVELRAHVLTAGSRPRAGLVANRRPGPPPGTLRTN